MLRRHLLIASRQLALGCVVLWGAPSQAQPRYTVTADQLQQVLGQRFPRRYPVAGLLNVDLQVPVLRMLAAQNRVA